MNRFTVTVVLLSCWLCAGKLLGVSPEVENARQHGARGRVTLHVADSTGKPVEKAQLSVAFWASDSSADVVVSGGQTDTNGCFGVEGKTVGDMNYTITKTGYYTTEGRYWFYPGSGRSVADGRWQPWNPTNTVVLKEHRNPIAMYAKHVDAPVPVRDAPVGFDLEVGDWVEPCGKGIKTDIFISYSGNIVDMLTFSNQLVIACSNRMDGLQRAGKETWSPFVSAYEAPCDGYQPNMVLSIDRTRHKILRREEVTASEYLVFRVRTVLDDKGNIVSARYGKIYGPIEYGESDTNQGGMVRFTYYLNPTDNDRNLEFDPRRNLSADPGRMRVYMP